MKRPRFRTACERNKATSGNAKNVTYDWYGIPHPADNTGLNQICELDHLISIEIGGADTLRHVQRIESTQDAALLVQVLALGAHDAVYGRSLAAGAELMQAL